MANTAKKHRMERELAPNLEPEWTSKFLIELRLQGVAGQDIGVALAEANSHCTESGESAAAAFGDPEEYARSLQLPPSPAQSPEAVRTAVLPTVVQLAGMLAVQATAAPLAKGEPLFEVTWGLLGSLVAVTVAVLFLARITPSILRRIVKAKSWKSITVLTGCFILAAIAGALPVILLDGIAAQVPVWAVLVGGVVVLSGGAVWDYRSAYLKDMDLISQPDSGDSYGSSTAKKVRWASTLLIPAFTLVMWIVFFVIVRAS